MGMYHARVIQCVYYSDRWMVVVVGAILVTCRYNYGEVALQCGIILRDALRHEVLLSAVLAQPVLMDQFFPFVQLPTFDVSSDAFATFKVRAVALCSQSVS